MAMRTHELHPSIVHAPLVLEAYFRRLLNWSMSMPRGWPPLK